MLLTCSVAIKKAAKAALVLGMVRKGKTFYNLMRAVQQI